MLHEVTVDYKVFLIAIIIAFTFSSCNSGQSKKIRKLPHVLVIGIDGLGAHGVKMADTPTLDCLSQAGAFSLSARTVVPSSSGPAWSSIITGATVERHGVGDNSWEVNNKILEPVFMGDHNMFPTIFGEIKKHCPNSVIGAVYHWSKFSNFIEKGVCDYSITKNSEDSVTSLACEYLKEKRPNFLFVHLDNVDHAGHHEGFYSVSYLQAVSKADSLVGVFVDVLQKMNMLKETVLFIVADHGGFGKSHGGTHPDEMDVPFIIYGKGVKQGYQIPHPVFNYDLAPTAAWLFGFHLNPWVSGKPIKDAFDGENDR